MAPTRARSRKDQMAPRSTHGYLVAGLRVRSEIVLPELLPDSDTPAEPDLEIRLAPVPDSLPESVQSVLDADVAPDDLLLNIPQVGRYRVLGGRRILVDPSPGVEDKDVRLFLLGSALGAVYFQRGYFPLHASVVVVNGGAVAFAGDSGAGKSTMAAWMNFQGYPLLCDDVCVIRFDDPQSPVAYPAYPRMKLWNDALGAFAMDTDGLQRDHFRADKYHLPVRGGFRSDPVGLRHVDILRFSEDNAPPSIEDVPPARAVPLLRDNTYRYQYISGLGLTQRHFLDCARLARETPVHYLHRPRNHDALKDCQRLIEEQMR